MPMRDVESRTAGKRLAHLVFACCKIEARGTTSTCLASTAGPLAMVRNLYDQAPVRGDIHKACAPRSCGTGASTSPAVCGVEPLTNLTLKLLLATKIFA